MSLFGNTCVAGLYPWQDRFLFRLILFHDLILVVVNWKFLKVVLSRALLFMLFGIMIKGI